MYSRLGRIGGSNFQDVFAEDQALQDCGLGQGAHSLTEISVSGHIYLDWNHSHDST
jgi:hypothetical protein